MYVCVANTSAHASAHSGVSVRRSFLTTTVVFAVVDDVPNVWDADVWATTG